MSGAASLFEGLPPTPQTAPARSEDSPGGAPAPPPPPQQQTRWCCGAEHVLLCRGPVAPLELLSLSLLEGSSGDERLSAAACGAVGAGGDGSADGELLQMSYQPGCCVRGPAGVETPCWLVLRRLGGRLRLCAVPEPPLAPPGRPNSYQRQQQQSSKFVVAEFEHARFQGLQPAQCHLAPGPLLVLQPEPELLLLLLLCPEAAEPTGQAAGPAAEWQLSELRLPARDLRRCLQPGRAQPLALAGCTAAAASVEAEPSDTSGKQQGGPWTVLHASLAAAAAGSGGDVKAQLLLALPVQHPAAAAREAPQQQEQEQQQRRQRRRPPPEQQRRWQHAVVWLEAHVGSCGGSVVQAAAAAAAADAHTAAGAVAVCWSFAVEANNVPTCAAVAALGGASGGDSTARPKLVAVGGSEGALQLLHCGTQQGELSAAQGEQRRSVALLAAAQLPGSVRGISHLRQVLVGGSVREDVLAVLHDSAADDEGTGAVVSLLAHQQGRQQLQVLAEVQGATGLLAAGCPALGLLCAGGGWQRVGGGAAALAALFVMQQGPSDQLLAAAAGVGGAWLPPGEREGAAPLPGGGLVGLLVRPARRREAAGAGLGDTRRQGQEEGDLAGEGELQGLGVMLAALEARWQEEAMELAAMQGQLAQGQRLAAAAHRQLVHLAADTLQRSAAQQHSLPLGQLDPQAAMAAFREGQRIALEQACEQQQLPPLLTRRGAASEAEAEAAAEAAEADGESTLGDMRLRLQLLGCSTRGTDSNVLELTVRLRPLLESSWQGSAPEARTGQGPASPVRRWWGPLLQPCHAELLLWHVDLAPVSSQCSWRWDAVSGTLAVSAAVARSHLLQLAAAAAAAQPAGGWRGGGGGGGCEASSGHNGRAAAAGGDHDAYLGVARAMATAVSAAVHGGEQIAGGGVSEGGAERLQLHAAVTVAACCSRQAVAQLEAAELGALQPAQALLQRSRLLTPAAALLHLPPLRLPVQQLLLQQLACSSGVAEHQHQPLLWAPLWRPIGGGAEAAAASPPRTPARDSAGASGPEPGAQPAVQGLAATDVIPPTPCSGCSKEGGLEEHALVIENSQQSEGVEEANGGAFVRKQQQQQQLPPPPPAAAAEVPAASGRPGEMGGAAPLHRQQLLLRCEAEGGVQQLVGVLQQLGLSASQAGAGAAQRATRVVLRPGGGCRGRVELTALGGGAAHVEVVADLDGEREALRQLLLLGVRRLQGSVRCEASPLSPDAHASCVAALDALGQAAALQRRALEEALQQLQLSGACADAGAVAVAASVAAAVSELPGQENRPPSQPAAAAQASKAQQGAKRPAPAADEPGDVLGAASGVLLVDGRPMGEELWGCWLSLLRSQAAADLAVAQMAAHG